MAPNRPLITRKVSFRASVSPSTRFWIRADCPLGYKEFSHIPTDRLTPADPLFAPALERMKISTRQYAKRQLKWVQKQMLPVVKQALERGEDVSVYVVRGGDEDAQLGAEILHRTSVNVLLSPLTRL